MRQKSNVTPEQAKALYKLVLPETRKWFWNNHSSAIGRDGIRKVYTPDYYQIFYRNFVFNRNEEFIMEVMAKNKEIKQSMIDRSEALGKLMEEGDARGCQNDTAAQRAKKVLPAPVQLRGSRRANPG